MSRKSTKINRKIRKTLVYYRARTRENRKITPRIHGVGDLVYYGGTEADPITPQDIYNAAVTDG